MNYSTAKRRYQSESLVYYNGQHWRILGLNRPAGTATLLHDGEYQVQEAPLKEITE